MSPASNRLKNQLEHRDLLKLTLNLIEDRIGTTAIPVDTEKIVAIVESDYQE